MATPAQAIDGGSRHSLQLVSPSPGALVPQDATPAQLCPPRWPVVVMAVAGSLSLALGLLVVVGWHTGHILSATALWFESVPVRYNAGICFVCAGIALLLLAKDKIGPAQLAAASLAILGLLTGCEYLLKFNLGIDELFFRTARLTASLPPRMAPNTAVCFSVLGGILLLAKRKPGALHNTLQAFAAGLVAAVGLVGFIGYAADIPTAYGWGRFTPMAAPTAAMMVALGAGTMAFAWRQHVATSPALPSWSPLLAGLTVAAGSVALGQALHVLHPRSGLDILALTVGLFQAALLYLVLHLLRGTRERARELRQLNSLLQVQMGSLERAEGQVREKQAYTRSLIEASVDPLVTIAPDGRITDVNAATEAVTGCSRQELVGTDFSDYFTAPEKARAGYQKVFREGGVRDYDLEIHHRDGSITPVLYNASLYHDSAGKVIGVFAAARDITERKRSEQAVRESENRYRALVLATSQIVWTTSPNGLVEDMPMWREYTGQTLEQVCGWGWLNAVHPEDREPTNTAWAQAVATRGVYEAEYRIRRHDGQYRYFVARGVPVLNADGAIREWVGVCSDVDERKRAEQELRATQQYTRSLIEASLDPLVAISNRGKITDVNRAAEEATGMTREELLGSEFCRYFSEPEKAHAAYEAAFAQGSLQGCPLALRHRSGRVTNVLYNASVFRNQAGEVEGVLAAARDITERKRLEDSLRQRTLELENSVAELEAFSYSVSHDLRAPLRSIDGFSQILLEDYHQQVDKEGQDCLRRIRVASQNMGQLIDALLQLSRVMRSELQREPVDLSVLALSTAAIIQKAEPSPRVRLHIASGLQARGDRRLLGVALQNLLQNAWKFTARNPDPAVEFGSTQKEGKTVYYVRDNGIGFDMAYVSKLFTPFQRLHAKEQFEGTGIGLATVQRVIKRHGGQVWAEGAVGKGATFYFSLE